MATFLRSINPIAQYFDYRRQRDLDAARERELARMERQEELALLRTTIEGAFKTSAAQTAIMQTFLAGFQPLGIPEVREWDDEAAERRYLEKRQKQEAALPPELAGLSQLEQFERLIDKMERE